MAVLGPKRNCHKECIIRWSSSATISNLWPPPGLLKNSAKFPSGVASPALFLVFRVLSAFYRIIHFLLLIVFYSVLTTNEITKFSRTCSAKKVLRLQRPILLIKKFWNYNDKSNKLGHTRMKTKFSFFQLHSSFHDLSWELHNFIFYWPLSNRTHAVLIMRWFVHLYDGVRRCSWCKSLTQCVLSRLLLTLL